MSDQRDVIANRQSFLGRELDVVLKHARIGVVGLSGGGSHVIQQLAHIGFEHFALYDPQVIEESNLHRLVGARSSDVFDRTPKVEIARRVILGVQPQADVTGVQSLWQDQPEPLRRCDLIFGCVDTFAARRELEVLSRRYRIPYVDIGMDVTAIASEPPRMAGQVVFSEPDGPCMFCMGFLNETLLTREAAQYGAVGGRPQVVWANGVLASTAVGMALDYLTGWTGPKEQPRFLSFDGNAGTVLPDARWGYRQAAPCGHYSPADVGDPRPAPI